MPPPRPRRRWRKLTDEITDALRQMILTGELAPGAKVTQDELARRLEVSTMPIREALLRLSAEGFVDADPNRAFRVAVTRREDIRDMYWMHANLAGELTARACANADDDLRAQLRELHDACAGAIGDGDAEGAEAANWRFHKAINVAADAPKLLHLLTGTLRMIPDGFYPLVRAWGEVSISGHARIVDAIERGDEQAARAAAEDHVRAAGELLIDNFSSTGFWTRPEDI